MKELKETSLFSQNTHYRFLYIGTTASGKTCMLAQMAEGAGSNSRFNASLLACDSLNDMEREQALQDRREGKNTKLRSSLELEEGVENLKNAKERLKVGKRPLPTSDQTESALLNFLMGDADENGRGSFCVQTEDYPGERINSANLSQSESKTSELMDRLKTYDGIIVVVETLNENSSASRVLAIQNQIRTLADFFTNAVNQKVLEKGSIPVALILSKWDKASKIDFSNPASEREKLEVYLKKYPQYYDILSPLKSEALSQDLTERGETFSGIIEGNTAVFPVSAFGEATLDALGENAPTLGQKGFGLVEPFC
ncbi:MAG: hypothetical protein Q4C70_14960 [Planctomycetia bacterium]|nr:hypothetical protein [Planctomycetia bacterium]